jgi:hypothetical protein
MHRLIGVSRESPNSMVISMQDRDFSSVDWICSFLNLLPTSSRAVPRFQKKALTNNIMNHHHTTAVYPAVCDCPSA